MTGIARRDALSKIAGLGFGAGALGLSGTLSAAAATQRRIPTASMRLTRTLERSLGASASLLVERRWAVRFTRQGRGIALSGEQTFAKVTAPSNLAPLARIEEERSTASMWPILLSPTGLIVGGGEFTARTDIKTAVQTAQKLISDSTSNGGTAEIHARDLAHLQNAASGFIEQLPRDLFFPDNEDPQTMQETVELPDGRSGKFSVEYIVTKSRDGWLQHARRSVRTSIGDAARTSSETWTMAAI